MMVLHANWYDGSLRLWAESIDAYAVQATERSTTTGTQSIADSGDTLTVVAPTDVGVHPFCATPPQLRAALTDLLGDGGAADDQSFAIDQTRESMLPLRLPARLGLPQPSARLASHVAELVEENDKPLMLTTVQVPCIEIPAQQSIALLLAIEDRGSTNSMQLGHALRYWVAVARFVLELLVDQRFVPTLYQPRSDRLRAAWQPWLHDEAIRDRVGSLIASMPAVARAVDDAHESLPWSILSHALTTLADATIRSVLERDDYIAAIEDADPHGDAHVAWLSGLLGSMNEVPTRDGGGVELLRDVGQWIGRLDEGGQQQTMRLCLVLSEPDESLALREDEPLPEDLRWRLSFNLQSTASGGEIIDAEQVWSQSLAPPAISGNGAHQPQELLVAELGRASRLYAPLEDALAESTPTGLDLTTAQAYEFLREHRPVLEESGVRILVPRWWDEPASRLGARLHIETPDSPEDLPGDSQSAGSEVSMLGLNAIVQYRWQIALGETPLTMAEFERLSQQDSPLVRLNGRWVEVRPEDLKQARAFVGQNSSGEMTLLEAIQTAFHDEQKHGLPVTGLDARGWVADLLGASHDHEAMPQIPQPSAFRGELRPYQQTGLSWLAFLDRFGLGACLADDMGLGKTIQLIALLQHERERRRPGAAIGPTMLIVPTSVVSNWVRELERFAPEITVEVHHGPERLTGEAFTKRARDVDVVITTYALVSRDQDTLAQARWRRVVLDEAQYIKNPPTKQTAAIRSLKADRRLALTGTPVENRLSELWSIMEFCNPGYLGPAKEFRRRFAIPIERHRDQRRAETLRHLVQPFILRRLKTDRKVISDLPACVETREYATLSSEQAALYESTVNGMLEQIDRSEGMQRRGLILATLVKLKQICNHPAQLLREPIDHAAAGRGRDATVIPAAGGDGASPVIELSRRSGKTRRMLELLEEVVATDGKALVFTQFRRMGHLLSAMIQNELDCQTQFLHGGSSRVQRQEMIDRFQDPAGGMPVFILSLKAGGLGLNLTAANHVFHFDRWWNPAVENQATDRAFRIGQTQTVHVHKFVCLGTLEERIDQMIEQKTELAQQIIGSGEQWLTELSSRQLHDLLTLRRNAMETDA